MQKYHIAIFNVIFSFQIYLHCAKFEKFTPPKLGVCVLNRSVCDSKA